MLNCLRFRDPERYRERCVELHAVPCNPPCAVAPFEAFQVSAHPNLPRIAIRAFGELQDRHELVFNVPSIVRRKFAG
jgi:hypothetical protein